MSLKRACRMLRMNDIPHAESGTAEHSRDEGIRNDASTCEGFGRRSNGSVQTHRKCAAGAAIPAFGQKAKRDCAQVPGQGYRVEPGAIDTSDPALAGSPANRTPADPPPEVCAPLHGRRYRRAGRSGCGSRRSFGTSGALPVSAGMAVLWGQKIPAASRDLSVAYLQFAQSGGLSENPGERAAHASAPGGDRGTTLSGPKEPARLSAGGYGPSRTTRWSAGRVPHQRRGHGDTVANRGLHRDHQRATSDTSVGSDAAPVPIPNPGIPLRQRVGVSEPSSGETVE